MLSKQDFDYIDKSSSFLDNNVFAFYYDLIGVDKDTIKTYSFITHTSPCSFILASALPACALPHCTLLILL